MLPTHCPFLPTPARDYTHHDIQVLGHDRGQRFYSTALTYAQSLWLAGFPAKAILQINRALSCYLPGVSLQAQAKPYHAKAWILVNCPADRFIGNPRRHYQHLATRMVEPHKELRAWRAWACWYIARRVLLEAEYPPDARQVKDEQIVKPRRWEIGDKLAELSPADDREAWESALQWAEPWSVQRSTPPSAAVTVRIIGPDEIETVRTLAWHIWPAVYPSIISEAQIHYMLERMYDPEVLRQEIVVRGVVYALIEAGGESIGYLAYECLPESRSAVLHRLYVKPEHHGHGVGAAALRWLADEARRRGFRAIRLRVNKRNATAIRAYLREGYVFEHDMCTEIGDGFMMDDHVLKKNLG